MSTVLEVSLLWGRYQATPWNRTPNEGSVEWPPSPWRLLRALYASWKTHEPSLSAEVVEALLEALVEPPSFVLPAHTETHTRHYFPGIAHREGIRTDTSKVINAMLVTERDARFWIEWACDLDDGQREILQRLAEGVRYLGRAESIVEVRLVDAAGDGDRFDPGAAADADSIRLLTPAVPLDVAALTMTPSMVRGARRLLPPSTRWTRYCRPSPARPTRPRRVGVAERVEAVRFELSASVLPSRFDAVTLADVAHRALVARSDGASAVLRGRDENGRRLSGLHGHAHYLPIPDRFDSGARRITGLVVWAPDGLTDDDLATVRRLRSLQSWRLDDSGVARMVVAGEGSPEVIAPEIAARAAVWESITPYVMTRHHKGELNDRLRADVRTELQHRGLLDDVAVELVPGSWLKFRRYRKGKEGIAAQRAAFGLRLTFAEPVSGPLALGQLSHFGLGMFRPVGT